MDKKFYEAPEMEMIKLAGYSALLDGSINSNPGWNDEEPDPDKPIIVDD